MENLNKDRLIADMKVVLADTENLLKAAAAATGDKAIELREKAVATLKQASDQLIDLQAVVVEKSRVVARATDDFVHEHPWKTAGIAVGVGFLLGLLVNRD